MSAKEVTVAVLPKITGCLSILGSSFNLCDILTDHKKRKGTYQRLIAAMAMVDIVYSFGYFCSTWPIPADSGVVWASGNTRTCAAQGFILQAGLAAPMYNLCLTIYSGMLINLKWSMPKIQKYELAMHITVLTVSLCIAIAGFPLTLYNNANLWCWIAAHPMNCHQGNSNGGAVGVQCLRGKYAWIYRSAFFFAPLWLIIVLVTCGVGIIAFGAYRDERTMRRKSANAARRTSRRGSNNHGVDNLSHLTNNAAWQCFYYAVAFYITWTFPTVLRALQTAERPVPYAVKVLMAGLLPMQGFFNAMVVLRPRFLRYRRNNPNESWVTTICKAITKTLAKLRPNKRTSPLDPSQKGNVAKSAVHDDGRSSKQKQPATHEQNDGNYASVVVKKRARARWWRSRTQSEDEDGNSSDEEDDQKIVTWRFVVEKALADDDFDLDPEMIEIRKSVVSAMSAAIGGSQMSTLAGSSAEPDSLQPQGQGTHIVPLRSAERENSAMHTQQVDNNSRTSPVAGDADEQEQDQFGMNDVVLDTVLENENNQLDSPEEEDAPMTTKTSATSTRPGAHGVSVPDDVQDTSARYQPGDNRNRGAPEESHEVYGDEDKKEEGLTVSQRLARRFPSPSHGPNLFLT